MKRILLTAAAAAAALTVAIGIYGAQLIRAAQADTLRVMQSIAGALTDEYPETAALIAEAANGEYSSDGERIMSRYGYSDDQELYGAYGKAMSKYYIFLIPLAAVPVCCVLCMYIITSRQKRRGDENVIYYLEHCLDGEPENAEQLLGERLYTPLAAVSERLRLHTEQAKDEQEKIKSLVTDISHQLKTPVSALKVCLDMYEEAQTDEERREFAQRMGTQADKLETLGKALISISQLEVGMIELKPEQTNTDDIIIRAVNAVYHKAAEKSIEISLDTDEIVEINADPRWTSEAIANILDNAVKYSPHGSAVRIRIQRLCSFVRIEISDSGCGIPRSERNSIFKRFFRGSSSEVQNAEGTGIGLYLSRRIIEEQGGTVTARPATERGSIFTVQLPL